MPFVRVVRLSRFVIFPSDDQHIALAVVVVRAVEPDVVIRVLGVPVEGLRYRAVRHFRRFLEKKFPSMSLEQSDG